MPISNKQLDYAIFGDMPWPHSVALQLIVRVCGVEMEDLCTQRRWPLLFHVDFTTGSPFAFIPATGMGRTATFFNMCFQGNDFMSPRLTSIFSWLNTTSLAVSAFHHPCLCHGSWVFNKRTIGWKSCIRPHLNSRPRSNEDNRPITQKKAAAIEQKVETLSPIGCSSANPISQKFYKKLRCNKINIYTALFLFLL